MPQPAQRVSVSSEGDVTIATLNDQKILDEVRIAEIGEQLYAVVARSNIPKLLLDFSSVANMSSTALGMLITLHKRVREKKGRLCFCNIQQAIQQIFSITRLNEVFEICTDRQAAMAKFK
ncbi:MAG: STAS domain-containing protein [Planctomycetes bacterium]|nr:STAS domain-containing protein [Planctomycetota bacterium]